MKKFLALSMSLVVGVVWYGTVASAAGPVTNFVFCDDFEVGMGNWTPTGTSPLDWSSAPNIIPTGGSYSALLNSSLDKMYHSLGSEVSGWSVMTYYLYDGPATRVYAEVRAYVGNGYNAGALQSLYAIGKYSSVTMVGEVYDATKYQGRIANGPGPNGWFNLNAAGAPSRSTGWHRFDIVRQADGTTYDFYVDGVLGRSFAGVTDYSWDSVVIGSVAAGSSAGDAWFDGVCVGTLTNPPPAKEYFFATELLPPPEGVYVTPAMWHAAFNNGIVIRDVRHRAFTQSIPPPPVAAQVTHSFGSQVEMDVSMDGGVTWSRAAMPVGTGVSIEHTSDVDVTQVFSTEMLMLEGDFGGVMIRESPTRAGTGGTTIRAVPGGNMISSFFDIYIEVSTDGITWEEASEPAHVELRPDPALVAAVPVLSKLLPLPVDQYVSPTDYHILTASGVQIKDVKHKLFTQSVTPPLVGAPPVTHHFDSQLDFQLSMDGGGTWQQVRAPAGVDVSITRLSSGEEELYDTEMLSLTIAGGDLPAGLMIRESPTEPSHGMTAIGGGGGGGGGMVQSFFDIYIEVSTDGGGSWQPGLSPGRVEARSVGPISTFPTDQLPPPEGEYVSPQQWHAYFANGIVISNVIHRAFTDFTSPPPLGQTASHLFGSLVEMDVSIDGGGTYSHVIVPATVQVLITGSQDLDAARYFDTEMEALEITSGLPGNLLIRESPTRASQGRTSVRYNGTDNDCDSFFDIYIEVSTDGGQSWLPASAPATVVLRPTGTTPLVITCPPNQVVQATKVGGATVVYPAPTISGGVPPIAVNCVPASGSHFSVGVTPVTCVARDVAGQTVRCTFTVKVLPPRRFFRAKLLPPVDGMYISPQRWHALYANGIIVSNVIHKRFTQGIEPPLPGVIVTHTFGSEVQLEAAMGPDATFQPYTAMADVTVRISRSLDPSVEEVYDTEMLRLDVRGGTLPSNVLLRASPTTPSLGETRIVSVTGGFMVSSFFDVFTEISTDGGMTWLPSPDPAPVELTIDPTTVPSVEVPTALLPPLVHKYVSPRDWHVAFANGVVISDVRHAVFTGAVLPPPYGLGANHTFDSQVDMVVTTGLSAPMHVRAPAVMTVGAQHVLDFTDTQYLETEAVQLDVAGGDLPAGLLLRESPTLRSQGGTSVTGGGGGGGMGGVRASSFFDIWVELSMDGGATWSPGTSGPVRVELQTIAPEVEFLTPALPPQEGEYVSVQQWHAYYAQGITISNVIHRRFTQSFPPPPPGGSATHEFDSVVEMMVFTSAGTGWTQVTAPAHCVVRITSMQDQDATRYFDTEMLQLNIVGGDLPAGVMIRESPTRASTGRTSERGLPIESFMISSFFDVFTELSVDGGQTWQPSQTGPATVILRPTVCVPPVITTEPVDAAAYCHSNATFCVEAAGTPPLVYQWFENGVALPGQTARCLTILDATRAQNGNQYYVVVANACGSDTSQTVTLTVIDIIPPVIVCPTNQLAETTLGRCDAVVQYPTPTASDDCGRVTNITCNPPSGATFPLGVTTVVCVATDDSGNPGRCEFKVAVVDNEPPHVTCPPNIVANTDPGMCRKTNVTYTATATDNCPGVTVACVPPSGSTFPKGTTAVTCTATDTSGNNHGCVFTVTIRDLETPVITCPADIVASTDAGTCRKTNVTYTATASDNCPGVTVACVPPSGSTFPKGVTAVTCTATDASDNSVNCTFFVTIRDLEAPVITCPPDIAADTDPGVCVKGNVTYTATATDNCPGVTVACVPPSGSTFARGVAAVTCTATDGSGNQASCTFSVTIRDREAPVITCPPNMIVTAYAPTGVVVNYPAPTASDNCAVDKVTCTPPSGSVFPVGVTTVLCTATDTSGNEGRCTFTVTVRLIGLEIDRFPNSVARLTVDYGAGQADLTLAGPTEVQVAIGANGECIDFDGDGLDQAPATMTQLDLTGFAMPLGHIQLHLRPGTTAGGEVEERVNNAHGRLDLAPFVVPPVELMADSFFDVFVEVTVDWPLPRTYHSDGPVRMVAVLTHKPPAPNEAYTNAVPVRLLDETGQSAGITLTRVIHIPDPKEVDVFPNSVAYVTVQSVAGAEPMTLFMHGPTTVEVAIPPGGWAADTDSNGRDQAPNVMTRLELQGAGSLGPVVLRLDPTRVSEGAIEERANNTFGLLDIAPFVPVSPTVLLADSFFDVWFEVTLEGLPPMYPAQAVRMVSVLTYKPPAPGETYTNSPLQRPIPLLLPDGTPSGYELVRVLHTPIPLPCGALHVQLVPPTLEPGPYDVMVCWKDDERCRLQWTRDLNTPILWQDWTGPIITRPDGTKCVRITNPRGMMYFRLCGGCPPTLLPTAP